VYIIICSCHAAAITRPGNYLQSLQEKHFHNFSIFSGVCSKRSHKYFRTGANGYWCNSNSSLNWPAYFVAANAAKIAAITPSIIATFAVVDMIIVL